MTEKQEKWLVEELMDSMKLPADKERTARRYISRTVDKILIYCNRADLPDQLLNTVVQMAEDMMKADLEAEAGKEVASITRGDTAISYRDGSAAVQLTVDFVKNYETSLNRYKRMNLPKDKKHE
ncbi:translation initiation factor 2 [Acetatifactor muris]|uniref:translation initiation factor 2 n=1 Tax=Acetatifactor muris TaxID=879566 RepID=UPI0023F0B707|nr:translation initiation factor 2 [Acetatifactor muris]